MMLPTKGKGLSSIEAVAWWFDTSNNGTEKRPYWTLYKGTSRSAKSRIMVQGQELSLDDSLDILTQALEHYCSRGGTHTIYLSTKPNMNDGSNGLTAEVTLVSNNTGIAGINNLGNNIHIGQASIETRIKNAVEMAMMKRDNEELKAALAAKVTDDKTVVDKIVDFASTEQGVSIGQLILERVFPQPQVTQGATVEMHGFNEEEKEEVFVYDEQLLVPLNKIRSVVGDDDFYTFLNKAADMMEKNPTAIISFFNSDT